MRLGELLLAENLVSKAALQEALEEKVVHGGRVGTNLVELGLLKEADLARMLGKQFGVAFASGEMTPDPAALALAPIEFYDDRDVLPMRGDATRLSVAVINPTDLKTLDELGFKTGKRVVPVVIPEFRMNQLQRRYCKAFRPVRSLDVGTIRKSRTLNAGKEEVPKGEELINDEDFQKLYAAALTGGEAGEEAVLEGAVVEEALPPPPAAQPVQAAALAPAAAPVRTKIIPLNFAEAQAELQKSDDREDVAQTIMRFARAKWRRVLLLSVQGGIMTGWHGGGGGVKQAAVRRIGIPLRPGGTFRLVRDTRSHFIGPVKKDATADVFYKLLGAGYPTTAVILPLLVRGKVVHMLYVDNGPDKVTPPDIGELLILSQGVAHSYEAMIQRSVA